MNPLSSSRVPGSRFPNAGGHRRCGQGEAGTPHPGTAQRGRPSLPPFRSREGRGPVGDRRGITFRRGLPESALGVLRVFPVRPDPVEVRFIVGGDRTRPLREGGVTGLEFLKAVQAFDLSWEEVKLLARNTLTYSFAYDLTREALLRRWETQVAALEAQWEW